MRIISQDGMIDIPYENFVFAVTGDNYIVAIRDTIARPDEIVKGVVAKYSIEAKAKKAMEILHEAYVAHENYKKLDSELQIRIAEAAGYEKAIMYGGIFKFPREDEI